IHNLPLYFLKVRHLVASWQDTIRWELKCQPPPSIVNGEHSGHSLDTFHVGTLVRYRCKRGFSLVGNKSVRCTTSGVWSHPPPWCKGVCSKVSPLAPLSSVLICTSFFLSIMVFMSTCRFSLPDFLVVKCLRPPNITNGKLKGNISDSFSYGASVSYSCNPGYSLVGNAFITCKVKGTWSQPPQCKGVLVLN
uniref:Uncharacterized protein n=1 Tax=Melopsittacus undulatus TaxID=13146 RepID=A0A8C6NCW7_MELUD